MNHQPFAWLFLAYQSGNYGIRLYNWYFTLKDLSRHRQYFSERNRINYRKLMQVGSWQLGLRISKGWR